MNQSSKGSQPGKDSLALWIAQGLGSGRIPFAPGTWGSVVGVLWFFLLLAAQSPWVFLIGMLSGVFIAVPVCGKAERLLGEKDPSSVVLDEIVAVPLAMLGYVVVWWQSAGSLPAVSQLAHWWPALLAGFLLFRLFDVWKPWPIRRLQHLPGGWGVVVDDLAAALLTAGLLWLGTWALFLRGLLGG